MSDKHPDRNGSPAGTRVIAYAAVGEDDAVLGSDEGAFLADLARAMQATVGAERLRVTQAADARQKARVEAIRGREAAQSEELRESAERDVKGIESWATAEIERIGQERERRTAARKTELEQRLEEHHSLIGREIAAVEMAIVAYRDEVDRFFARLDAESDPIAIAQAAGNLPPFPALDHIPVDDAHNGSSNGSVPDGAPPVAQDAVPAAQNAEQPAQEAPSAQHAGDADTDAERSPETASGADDEASAEGSEVAAAVAVPVADGPTIGVMEKTAPVLVAAAVTAWDGPASDAADSPESNEGSDTPVAAGAKITPRSSGAVIHSVPTHRPIGSWLRRNDNPD